MTAPHPSPRETWRFDTAYIGRRVLVYDELDSTNTLGAALAASDEDADGVVIVADNQRAGRGQYGRTWVSRPGSSLLLSVVLRPPPELRRPVVLTAWAAVAVADTIARLAGAQPLLKWPNDLLVGGKKTCGILIEQSAAGGHVTTVAGVGLNLNQSADEFARSGLPDATSLALLAGVPVVQRPAAECLVRALDAWYGRILAGGLDDLEEAWKHRVGLLGEPVRVEHVGGAVTAGRLRGMTFGGVEVEDAAGPVRVIPPEQIAHLRPS